MSELGDELHRLADQGAEQARPLPAAEIIRRGDQRRRRRMVGGTVAGLAVAGAITGGILSGVAGGGGPAPVPAGQPSGPGHHPPRAAAGGEHAGAGALRHLALGRPESQGLKPAAGAHQEWLARARVASPRPGVAGPSFRSCGYGTAGLAFWTSWVNWAGNHCPAGMSYPGIALVG